MAFTRLAKIILLLAILHFVAVAEAKRNKKPVGGDKFDIDAEPGKYTCPCGKSFKTTASLSQHMRDTGHDKKYNTDIDKSLRQSNENKDKTGRFTCPCGKTFKTQSSLAQHLEDTGHGLKYRKNTDASVKKEHKKKVSPDNQFTCPCGKSFKSKQSLLQHMKDTGHDGENNNPNSDNHEQNDGERTENLERRKLHRTKSIDRDEKVESFKERRRSIDEMEKETIKIDKKEKKWASVEYSYYMQKIVNHIRTLKNGKIYSSDFRKAGSHSVKTKVGKADEFDTNIVLRIDVDEVLTQGKLTYIYDDKKDLNDMRSMPRRMSPVRRFRDISSSPIEIPHGQAVVRLKDPSTLPGLTYKGDLIPHKVLQDLHHKVATAIQDLELTNVELSPNAQGPALTITIKDQYHDDINVDLVPSLPCDLPVTLYGWPRKQTRKVFRREKVEAVKKAGLHLVPKGDETWTISYSKAERELLKDIDDNNECRKQVMKIIKHFLEKCKAESDNGLPGLSSHIVKIQLLWSSENRAAPGYWSQKYEDRCLLDTIDDMIYSLKTHWLSEYFDEVVNILEPKQDSELLAFADCLERRKTKLENTPKLKRDEL